MLRRKQLPGEADGPRVQEGDTYFTNHMGRDEPPYDAHNPILDGETEVAEAEYLTDAFTREAIKFIDQASDGEAPFFLLVSYNAVHSPLQATNQYMDKLAFIKDVHRRIFAGMLSNLDDSVGQILARLRERQIDENTLIVFLSDNGGPTKELTSSNLPLRGGKGSLYEGGIRVPFLWRWKGTIPSGQEIGHPIISTDIAATALAAAGLEQPEDTDGVNLLPLLKADDPKAPHDVIYWRMHPQTALRKGDWKIVRPRGKRQFELYHLASDISEKHELSTEQPQAFQDLIRTWMSIDVTMSDPLPRPIPPPEQEGNDDN